MKRMLLFLLLFSALNVSGRKQGQKFVDSLSAELPHTADDTVKVNILNCLSFNYQNIDLRKGIRYGTEALQLAKRLRWEKGIANAENNLAGNYNLKRVSDTALLYSNSAMATGQRLGNNEIVANSYINAATSYNNLSDFPRSLEYATKALRISKQMGNKALIGNAMLCMGIAYFYLAEYDKALEYQKLTRTIAEQTDNQLLAGSALSCLGIVYNSLGDNGSSIACHNQSLKIAERYGYKELGSGVYQCLGNGYNSLGDYLNAYDCYQKALKMTEDLGNEGNMLYALFSIAATYSSLADYPKALEYFGRALKISKKLEHKVMVASCYISIGDCYEKLKKYPQALVNYLEAGEILKQVGHKPGMGLALYNIGHTYFLMSDYVHTLAYLQQLQDLCRKLNDKSTSSLLYFSLAELYVRAPDSVLRRIGIASHERYFLALSYADSSLAIYNEMGDLAQQREAWELISIIYERQGKPAKALSAFKKYISLRDSMMSEIRRNDITRKQMQFDFDKRQLADSLKNADIKKMATLRLEKQRTYTYAGFTGVAMLLLLSFFIFKNYSTQKKSNKLLSMEKHKSESLLLNILPAEVAEELKENGTSEARQFNEVSVLFTDFVNFTEAGERMKPKELVSELHACFKAFDEIIGRYNIEKIKTIGDAYLAACGLPIPNPEHAMNMVNAALEIMQFMRLRKQNFGDQTFHIRIGIHSGPVVAGIVGVTKFAYDIWGDTVNTAARMEQNSEAGKINISGTTYELVKDKFECSYRGEITAKNKGAMRMYFVKNIGVVVN